MRKELDQKKGNKVGEENMKIISQSAGTDNAQQLRWVQFIYIQQCYC